VILNCVENWLFWTPLIGLNRPSGKRDQKQSSSVFPCLVSPSDNAVDGVDDSDDEDEDDIPLGQLLRITRQAAVDRDTLATFYQDIPTEDNGEDWEKNLFDEHLSRNSDETVSNRDSEEEGETETPTVAELNLSVNVIVT